MLRIAICDDDEAELRKIEHLVNEYMTEKDFQQEISTFNNPDDLIKMCEKEPYAIYILDIVMPMVNGIELGKEIRQKDQECQIIYTTTAPEYALESFAAHPLNYLIKPVEKEILFTTLGIAVSKVEKNVDDTITVKTKDGIRILRVAMILCCEYREHRIIYYLRSGEQLLSVTTRTGFKEQLAPLLVKQNFIQCHAAFVCNMKFIERMTGYGFDMQGGTEVPISKKMYNDVRNAYLDYRFGREENH